MDYEFWDDDIKKAENQAYVGNDEVVKLIFKEPVEGIIIHKDDVIHLANSFGLSVYDSKSKL